MSSKKGEIPASRERINGLRLVSKEIQVAVKNTHPRKVVLFPV
jgi:hypothetical protein